MTLAHVNDYHVLQIGEGQANAAAAAPGRSLLYLNPVESDYGITSADALSNGWVLQNGGGGNLVSDYGKYVLDVGDAGLQAAFITSAISKMTAHGVDGCYLDNVFLNIHGLISPDQYPAAYPNVTAWRAAYSDFCANVGPALTGAGYYVLPGIGGWYADGDGPADRGDTAISWLNEVGGYFSGAFQEHFCQSPGATGAGGLRSTGAAWYRYWDEFSQRFHRACNTLGIDFVGSSVATSLGDLRTMLYCKASFQLEWDGGEGSVLMLNVGSYVNETDPWHPAWTRDIGTPTGAKSGVGVGFKRIYSNGVACVNPDPNVSQTFDLGAFYVRTDGTTVDSVTLSPVSAEILTPAADVSPGGTEPGGDGTVGVMIFQETFEVDHGTPSGLSTTAEAHNVYGPKGSGSSYGQTWTQGVGATPGSINEIDTPPAPGAGTKALHVYLPPAATNNTSAHQANFQHRYFNLPANGEARYYGMMWYLPTGFKNPAGHAFADFLSCNYQAYSPFIKGGGMLSWSPWDDNAGSNGMKVYTQSGYGVWAPTQPPPQYNNGQNPYSVANYTETSPDDWYIIPEGQLTKDVWHETIVAVKWTTNNDGWIKGWWRRKGESTWNNTVNVVTNRPTAWWGIDEFGVNWLPQEVLPASGTGVNTYQPLGAYRWERTWPMELWYDNFCHATGFGVIAATMP